jgi:hypothetical protein
MFLLEWDGLTDSSTLQEKRVKINKTLDAKACKKTRFLRMKRAAVSI